MASERTPGRVLTPDTCPPYCSIADFAATFGCSEAGVSEAIKAGTLVAREISPRIIRIPREELFPQLAPPALLFEDRQVAKAATGGLERARAVKAALGRAAEAVDAVIADLEQVEAVLEGKASRATASPRQLRKAN